MRRPFKTVNAVLPQNLSSQAVFHLVNLQLEQNLRLARQNWSIGDIALHKKWGEGTVLEVSGSGATQELKINFPEVGLKKLLASVAPIEKKNLIFHPSHE